MVRSKQFGDCTYEEAELWLEIDGSTGARKKRSAEVLFSINAIISRYGWVTKGDIGAKDFKTVLRLIYALPAWSATTRGWLLLSKLSF